MNQASYKFAAQVGAAGKLEVTVPVPAGTPVEVLVLTPSSNELADPADATTEDIFAEMERFTVSQLSADDSRGTIYRRLEGE